MADQELAPGHLLDRKYEVIRKLGAGGMGTVYEVVHRMTKRHLALKALKPEFSQDAEAVARFLREIQVAATLRHPNIVEVADAGQDPDQDVLYIAMELLEGEELLGHVTNPSTPRETIFAWLLEVLSALGAAHEVGIVHRDLKPENVFLARGADGGVQAKLLDFGIARNVQATSVTMTGIVVGTPLYMSPEQALRPKTVDHRADLWSFGVMLYEVLCGSCPFIDESPAALVLRAAGEPHQPIQYRIPGVDPRLVAIVDACLRKNPAERPASAADVRRALEDVVRSPAPRGGRVSHVTTTLSRDQVTTSDGDLARSALRGLSMTQEEPPPVEASVQERSFARPLAFGCGVSALTAVAVIVGLVAAGGVVGTSGADPAAPTAEGASAAAVATIASPPTDSVGAAGASTDEDPAAPSEGGGVGEPTSAQDVADDEFAEAGATDEGRTGDEGTGDEGSGDEGTGDEGTGDEGTGDEGSGDQSGAAFARRRRAARRRAAATEDEPGAVAAGAAAAPAAAPPEPGPAQMGAAAPAEPPAPAPAATATVGVSTAARPPPRARRRVVRRRRPAPAPQPVVPPSSF